MLLKFALTLGVDFVENVTFEEICPKNLTVSLSHESLSSRLTGRFDEITECDDETDDTKCRRHQDHCDDNKQSDSPDGNCLSSSSSNTTSPSKKSSNQNSSSSDQNPLLSSRSRSSLTISVSKDSRRSSCCDCCCHIHEDKSNDSTEGNKSSCNFDGAFAHFSLTSCNPTTPSTTTSSSTTSPFSSAFVNDYPGMLSRLHSTPFHVILGADGRRNTLADHFPRKEFRGRLAIAITANFVNKHTLTEAQIPEISGISFIYNQQLFK